MEEKKYYTYEEIKPIALQAMREKLLNSEHTYLGNIEKQFDNKVDVGIWLKQNGYVAKEKYITLDGYIFVDNVTRKEKSH